MRKSEATKRKCLISLFCLLTYLYHTLYSSRLWSLIDPVVVQYLSMSHTHKHTHTHTHTQRLPTYDHLLFYYAGWGYIVVFTKVLIIYQMYHTWIHSMIISLAISLFWINYPSSFFARPFLSAHSLLK
jgi:hypothetical protein